MASRRVSLNLYVPETLAVHLKQLAQRKHTSVSGLLEDWAREDPRSRYMSDEVVAYVLGDYWRADHLSPSQAREAAVGHLVQHSHLNAVQAEAVVATMGDWAKRPPAPRPPTPAEQAAQREREFAVLASMKALAAGSHPTELERDLLSPNERRRTGYTLHEARAIIAEAERRRTGEVSERITS